MIQVTVDPGYGVKQALAEIEQAIADFVLNRGFMDADFVGFPQYLVGSEYRQVQSAIQQRLDFIGLDALVIELPQGVIK